MGYITAADFRSGTLAEYCVGLTLTADEARTALLEAAIQRVSDMFDDLTGDHYEPVEKVLTATGEDTFRIYLPERCTAVTAVTVDGDEIDDFILHPSLDADGAKAIYAMDWLDRTDDTFTGSVAVAGTFGWTVTPGDVKRAVALMVWNHFKPMRADLRRAQRISTQQESVDFVASAPTGLPEADAIIERYTRTVALAV